MSLVAPFALPKNNMSIENVGPQFNLELYLKAREKTIAAVHKTAEKIRPGMTEADALAILNDELAKIGVEKFWHPTKFRMNKNTTKSFRDPSEEGVVLEKNDVFFIDIGPVFDNHEGDYGETFFVGDDEVHEHLKNASKCVFQKTQYAWKHQQLSGRELYSFAEKEAKKLGLTLNTKMYGHRLGDFPHALYYKGKLGEIETTPAPHLWVLEIHLIDEKNDRGAFFEDILL